MKVNSPASNADIYPTLVAKFHHFNTLQPAQPRQHFLLHLPHTISNSPAIPALQHLICPPGAGQGKVVTSLDVDHSGSRLLAGSRDYSLRMFDFNGMKSDMRSFRRLEPSDGHPVHSVSLSPTGQLHGRNTLMVLW